MQVHTHVMCHAIARRSLTTSHIYVGDWSPPIPNAACGASCNPPFTRAPRRAVPSRLQLETLMATKADISDMERRALKTEVDAGLRTQMSDLYTLMRSKAEDSEFKVGGRAGHACVCVWEGGGMRRAVPACRLDVLLPLGDAPHAWMWRHAWNAPNEGGGVKARAQRHAAWG